MSKGIYDRVVTVEDLVRLCELNGKKGGGETG